MGTALTGNTIASSYLGLIKSTDSLAIGTSAKRITDGAGNDLPIKLTTTQMFFNVGTVTAPALSFDGNISEGFYIPTDENIGVCIAGSEIARFNGTGISLTSSKLTLDNDQKIRWTSDDVYIQGTTSADNIQLGVGGSTQFTFAQTTGLRLHQYGGGSITGTVTQRLGVTSTGQVVEIPIGAGALDGSGTAGKLAKFTDSDTLGDSILSESSTVITNTGVFNISNGTAGNPAYSFTDATNTGMFRDGTNLKFSLAGVVGLSIDGNSDTVINKNLKLSDAFKIKLGDSDDVEIYHDTNSFIENSTGYLMLKSDTAIYLRSKTGNQPYINAIKGAEVSLFFNDSQKFETTNTGVKTTGQGIFTGFVAIGGTSPDESLHITNSSGANIILNSDANTADSGIYMSEGADATPTQNGAYLHYDASANEFKIATGGGALTDRFTIARDTGDSTFAGSVSILKSSLGGTTAMSDGTLIFGAGSTNYFSFRLDASADLHLDKSFSSASSTVLTIDRSTSNIGIGTTSPIVPFHVVGTAVNNPSNGNGGYEVMQVFDDTSYATGVGGGIGFGGNFTSSNSTIFSEIRGIKENATDNNYAGALTFSTRANGGSITERLRINSSGNSLFQGGINLQDSGTNKVWLTRAETILGGSDDDFLIYTETGLNIRLYTSGNERLRVDSSGNVGIGTTSPDVKAHIFGGSDSPVVNGISGFSPSPKPFGLVSSLIFSASLSISSASGPM